MRRLAGIAAESLQLKNIPFVKMSGSGNDFIVVDNRSAQIAETELGEWTRKVCRRRLSVGADGVVFLENPSFEDRADYRWRYFNADGSEGEMCGNGAMCGAHVAVTEQIAGTTLKFETLTGVVAATIEPASGGSLVWLDMPDTGPLGDAVAIDWHDRCVELTPVDIGVPHVVLLVDDAESFASAAEFHAFGAFVRFHEAFEPRGTNVNVISRNPGGSLRMRTYERGVEAETLACGTGAVASTMFAKHGGCDSVPQRIITSSGATLSVELDLVNGRGTNVRLGGNAKEIARGTIRDGAMS